MEAVPVGLRADRMSPQGEDDVLPVPPDEFLRQQADDVELADDALLGHQRRKVADGVVRTRGGEVLRVEEEHHLRRGAEEDRQR